MPIDTHRTSPMAMAGVGLIIAGMAGYLFLTPQLDSARPESAPHPRLQGEEGARVPARLWQDPYAAATDHFRVHSDDLWPRIWNSFRIMAGMAGNAKQLKHKPGLMRGNLEEIGAIPEDATLRFMPVFIPGSGYAEDIEDRLRTRYALVSALFEAEYEPYDRSHVSYLFWTPTSLFEQMEKSVTEYREKETDLKEDRDEILNMEDSLRAQDLAKWNARSESHKEQWRKEQDSWEHALRTNILIIPYEWYINRQKNEYIFVAWVDEGYFADRMRLDIRDTWSPKPLRILGELAEDIVSLRHDPEKNVAHPPITLWRNRVSIIGPKSSGTLKDMLAEIENDTANEINKKYIRFGARDIYSPWCTVDEKHLGRPENYESSQPDQWIKETFDRIEFDFERVGSDHVLVEELIDELQLRGRDPICVAKNPEECPCKDDDNGSINEIVLISELDTVYADSFRKTFDELIGGQGGTVHHRTYIRGIDGAYQTLKENSSGARSNSTATPNNSSTGESESAYETYLTNVELDKRLGSEFPTGPAQIDYLRRLQLELEEREDRIRHNRPGHRIAAIGVIGNDTYDKLLVFRALRTQFRHALFFTTDLDAGLFAETEYPHTRNLIIASHFGLRLHDDLQGSALSFRSGYQTAVFYGVLRAADYKGINSKNLDWTPRRFEIGRSGPFDLSAPSDGPSIHPEPDKRFPKILRGDRKESVLWLMGIGVLVLLWLAPPVREQMMLWYRLREPGSSVKTIGTMTYRFIAFIIFALLTAGVFAFVLYLASKDVKSADGEPFVIFEGISTWPTIFIRLFTVFLSIYFVLVIQMSDLPRHRGRFMEFHGANRPRKRDSVWRKLIEIPKDLVAIYGHNFTQDIRMRTAATPREVWEAYDRRSRFLPRLLRAILPGLVYFFLYIYLSGLEDYFMPQRGELNQAVDSKVQKTILYAYIVLVVWTLDATLSCTAYIRELRLVRRTASDSETRTSRAHEYLTDARMLKLIADETEVVAKFTYYAFFMIILTMLARSWYFDYYNWPLVVLCYYAIAFVINGFSLWALQRSAKFLRRDIVDTISFDATELRWLQDDVVHAAANTALAQVNGLRTGAFTPFLENPVVRALLIPLGGIGGLFGLEYFI